MVFVMGHGGSNGGQSSNLHGDDTSHLFSADYMFKDQLLQGDLLRNIVGASGQDPLPSIFGGSVDLKNLSIISSIKPATGLDVPIIGALIKRMGVKEAQDEYGPFNFNEAISHVQNISHSSSHNDHGGHSI